MKKFEGFFKRCSSNIIRECEVYKSWIIIRIGNAIEELEL